MKFTIRKTSLMKMLRALKAGKEKDMRDSLLRVSAHNGTVTMNANDVEAGCEAQVIEEGVCFFQYERFLPLLQRYPQLKTITIGVTPEGMRIGNTDISRGFWEVSLFQNPSTGPSQLRAKAEPLRAEGKLRDSGGEAKGTLKDLNFVVVALDAAERTLAKQIDDEEVQNNKPAYASNAKDCDLCQRLLSDMGLFVDGELRGKRLWANMCAACFLENGEAIGWGTGQLYARQADEEWRLVAGFPPEDDTDYD